MATTNESDGIPVLEIGRQLMVVALVLTGLYLTAFGSSWSPLVLGFLPASEVGRWLELIVPFLPMAFIGSGAALFASGRRDIPADEIFRTPIIFIALFCYLTSRK